MTTEDNCHLTQSIFRVLHPPFFGVWFIHLIFIFSTAVTIILLLHIILGNFFYDKKFFVVVDFSCCGIRIRIVNIARLANFVFGCALQINR